VKFTESHRREQELLHLDPDYGSASVSYARMVSQIINRLKVTQLLDYGCGKARLMKHLDVAHEMKLQCYDPAMPAFSGEPLPMQMVACIDVLEHVEPECLDAVLDDLVRVTEVIGFFTVCTEPAEKTLSDGSNAHKIIKPTEWWLPKLMERFELQTMQTIPGGFYVIVYARKRPLVETLQ
jgi:hypothetical protein